LEGVNFASRPLIHFLIKNLSCYSKKHAARIKMEGIYTAEEPLSHHTIYKFNILVVWIGSISTIETENL
jgi:hypothetical protein